MGLMITFKQYIFKNIQSPLLEMRKMRDFSLKDGYWFELIQTASRMLKFFNKYEKEFINWLKNGKGKKWFLNKYQPIYPNKDASDILSKISIKYWNEALEEQIKNTPNYHSSNRTKEDDERVSSRMKKLFVEELYTGFKLEDKQQQVKDAISKNDQSGWDL